MKRPVNISLGIIGLSYFPLDEMDKEYFIRRKILGIRQNKIPSINTHPIIHPHFALKDHWNYRKAPVATQHHKAGRSRSKRAPRQSEGERGGRRAE